MPTLIYCGERFECVTAIKGNDYIHLLDENGVMSATFDGISDFSKFTLEDGSYTAPTADHDCYLAVIRDDGTIGRGGHRCSELSELKFRVDLISNNLATITVTVKTASGTGIGGVQVTNVFDEFGVTVSTDSNGVASGYVSSGDTTISVSGYADIEDVSDTSAYTKGSDYTKTLTVTPRNFLKVTSSQNLKFSSNVQRVDATCVGGGGSGGNSYRRTSSRGDTLRCGGGGGGGYCTVKESVDFIPNTLYPVVIGAGGALRTGNINYTGIAGGTTSFLGITANGGNGGTDGSDSTETAIGNGNGGTGNYYEGSEGGSSVRNGGNGVAGSVAGYSSFTETVVYGGGGGGGSIEGGTVGSGAGYGGDGGKQNSSTSSDATHAGAGADGYGGGGGGGGMGEYGSSDELVTARAGKGGSGCVAIRMHLKSA